MTHIVFNAADAEVLKKAMELDESLLGDVVEIKDDYAVGPVIDIYETYGYQSRRNWWQEVLENSPYTGQLDILDDKLTVHNLCNKLKEDSNLQVWIWMGQNAHDVCGYYWLMSQLGAFQGQVFVLYMNNLPFINEKGGIFYPAYLYEIQPKEFLKAKKLARPITLSEFEVDPDEWKRIGLENGLVRVLEGGKKIVSKDAGFFDKEIKAFIQNDPQKLPKMLQQVANKSKLKISDVFMVWRMREMEKAGIVAFKGDWAKGWKDMEVMLNNTAAIEQVSAE
ncbi:DUF1835 domain-containing protein [Hydrotalea sandarakina]|jgi:hypothetical protein|uniref:Uncharacterized protein DUF3658 n=1 Tax=Hydrotalea sandarakina TaxID=1004304 RepID=A0A2W7RY98_9BACT|nr:DUF1835 domain-containing protein [Hydrotalea sandarakina]PZX65758.1 uncharacterized protein DUF3658 [Hydrotalea sandarakina]